MENKLCAKCNENPRHNNYSYCKTCLHEIRHQSYLRRREKVLAYNKEWRARHKEAQRAYHRDYARSYRRKQHIKAHPEIYNTSKYWDNRTRPTTTTIPIRFNIEVHAQGGKWSWDLKIAMGVKISSTGVFDTCKKAWEDARDFLKGFRERIQENNESFRKEAKLEG